MRVMSAGTLLQLSKHIVLRRSAHEKASRIVAGLAGGVRRAHTHRHRDGGAQPQPCAHRNADYYPHGHFHSHGHTPSPPPPLSHPPAPRPPPPGQAPRPPPGGTARGPRVLSPEQLQRRAAAGVVASPRHYPEFHD